MIAARYSDRWPPVPGRFRVALYKGDYAESPVTYSRAAPRLMSTQR